MVDSKGFVRTCQKFFASYCIVDGALQTGSKQFHYSSWVGCDIHSDQWYSGPAMAVYNQWGEGELKYVFRVDVKNEQTLPFIRDTLYPGECREWNDKPEVWEKGSDGYQAILGTPNGKGVGALVLGHYGRGMKNIPEIITLVDGHTDKLQILFKIE